MTNEFRTRRIEQTLETLSAIENAVQADMSKTGWADAAYRARVDNAVAIYCAKLQAEAIGQTVPE